MKQRYTVGLFFILVVVLLGICISSLWLRHSTPAKIVDPYFYQSQEEEKEEPSTTVFTQDVILKSGYYILYKDNKVSVYLPDQQTLFFTTDLQIEDVSMEMLEHLREGIYMETEEDVYHFLESYSS